MSSGWGLLRLRGAFFTVVPAFRSVQFSVIWFFGSGSRSGRPLEIIFRLEVFSFGYRAGPLAIGIVYFPPQWHTAVTCTIFHLPGRCLVVIGILLFTCLDERVGRLETTLLPSGRWKDPFMVRSMAIAQNAANTIAYLVRGKAKS